MEIYLSLRFRLGLPLLELGLSSSLVILLMRILFLLMPMAPRLSGVMIIVYMLVRLSALRPSSSKEVLTTSKARTENKGGTTWASKHPRVLSRSSSLTIHLSSHKSTKDVIQIQMACTEVKAWPHTPRVHTSKEHFKNVFWVEVISEEVLL